MEYWGGIKVEVPVEALRSDEEQIYLISQTMQAKQIIKHPKMKHILLFISVIFLFNEHRAQDTLPCDKKIIKYVRTIMTDCINIDSVEEFVVDEYSPHILSAKKWNNKNYPSDTFYSSGGKIYVEPIYTLINKIEDSIFIYKNLMQINVVDYNILPIFPQSISKLPNLSGIYNNGIISDKTFESVTPLPLLMGITIGAVTDSLTKIPEILTSKKLQEVEIFYIGEGDKIILNILQKMLKKKSIKRVSVIPVHGAMLSEAMIRKLSKLKIKYEHKDIILVFY